MAVERTQLGHQTRYVLRDDSDLPGVAAPAAVLTYGSQEIEPAVWKILLPGPGGTEDLYGTERFPAPSATRLLNWLAPLIGFDHAFKLASSVDAEPPKTSGWTRPATGTS